MRDSPQFERPTRRQLRQRRASAQQDRPADFNAMSAAVSRPEASIAPQAPRKRRWWRFMTDPVVCYCIFIAVVAFLTIFGLVMVFSSSSVDLISAGQSPYAQLITQGIYAVIGVAAAFAFGAVPVRMYKRFATLFLAIALVLQVAASSFGKSVGGNTGWLEIGPIQFQPAEVVKLALCVWMPYAIYVGKKLKLGKVGAYITPAIGFGLAVLAVLIGKDLGSALIFGVIGVTALFAGGLSLWAFFALFAAGAVAVAYLVFSSGDRMDRIHALLGGCNINSSAAQGICYQTIHSNFAVGSGGIWGVGLGASREKWNYLPEAHNDFIFAIISEETGFIGALGVILCFVLIAWTLIVIASKMKDKPYERLVLICIMAWLCSQALINISVVLEILPVIGLPLPFVSSGGTALIMCLASVGVAARMASEEKHLKRMFNHFSANRRKRRAIRAKKKDAARRERNAKAAAAADAKREARDAKLAAKAAKRVAKAEAREARRRRK